MNAGYGTASRWVGGIFISAAAAMFMLTGCPGGGGFSDKGSTSDHSFFKPREREAEPQKEGLQILCGEYTGQDRRRVAEELANGLRRVAGLDATRVAVLNDVDRSTVTYGPYAPSYEPQGGIRITPEMRQDMSLIRSLSIEGQCPFLTAFVQPAPTPDPGNPEWDLRRAGGVYSLQIGVFFNTASFFDRKEAAAEWVKDLRGRGLPAFYYHDNVKGRSTVTVGSFDESAYIAGRPVRGTPNAPSLEIGPQSDYSQEVIQLQNRGPEFRYNHENLAEIKVNGVPQSSFLIKIPHPTREEMQP